MYKKINYIAAVLILLTTISVKAQVTTQSPYSKYGLGNVRGSLLPQFRAMGGISTGVYKPSIYSNINMQNPASYTGITMTTLDMGMSAGFTEVKKNGIGEASFNSTLSHVAMAFPLKSGKSAISVGILPYTELGYEFSSVEKYSATDTNSYNALYSGEGGLTKAYFGIGQQFGDHFRIGANVEYLFGNLQENRSIELQASPSINNRQQNKNSIGGIGFSYGLQYDIPLSSKSRITLGYSGSSPSKVNSTKTFVVTQYFRDAVGEEQAAFDTVLVNENSSAKLKLPLIHNFGFSIQKDNKWMFGADYRMGQWSKLNIDNTNQGLQDSWGFSTGAQITPDITSIGSYFKRVDYRFGFQYDKTYIQLNEQDVKQMAVTLGFGLPLAPNRYSFYKMNFTTELGRRGKSTNGLIQESYINFHLGFTLNDRWFTRFRFD
ncbi:porin family protein [Pedobacter frigoris]|uniref:Long-chain fatty acid transport protein n=1 Tax=Pedobacter frigoris TaxID=2571272 RepID=A0A4U1CF74_9SPHI|nr:hypothetical protein [Pedobacter frigoris]TKC05221.1 hypothetical protein FA047_15810 [Pedobacter frigoris]